MIINSSNLKIFYLTTGDSQEKINHLSAILSPYDFKEVRPFELGVDRRLSGSIGHARLIEMGLRAQRRNMPFQPFLILEDDVSFYREMPDFFDIPDDADLLYLGVSRLGMLNGHHSQNLIASEIDENLLRVFNMLSGHAILICSHVGASAYQKCMIDGYHHKRMWDAYAAEVQPWVNAYSLKVPVFYQDKDYGGREHITKFEIEEISSPLSLTLDGMEEFTAGAAYRCASYNTPNLEFLRDLSPIPKKVHISWRTKDVVHSQNPLILNGLRNLIDMNPDWDVQISIDTIDVENYLADNLSSLDYSLLKDKPIVEKVDVWRLLKVYLEGGMYVDIDRHCNKVISSLIGDEVKCILPFHKPHSKIIDFSQDIILTSPRNPMHGYALELNLRRRRSGWTDIMTLGPITYFHAMTKFLYGFSLDRFPSPDAAQELVSVIDECPYLDKVIESVPHETLIFSFNEQEWKNGNNGGKEDLYKESGVEHWSVESPIIRENRKFD